MLDSLFKHHDGDIVFHFSAQTSTTWVINVRFGTDQKNTRGGRGGCHASAGGVARDRRWCEVKETPSGHSASYNPSFSPPPPSLHLPVGGGDWGRGSGPRLEKRRGWIRSLGPLPGPNLHLLLAGWREGGGGEKEGLIMRAECPLGVFLHSHTTCGPCNTSCWRHGSPPRPPLVFFGSVPKAHVDDLT
ncbi:unnamed protein product [Boreogadus saida]